MGIERSRNLVIQVQKTVGRLPELQPTIKTILDPISEVLPRIDSLRYIQSTYLNYLRLIRTLTKLSPEDKILISKANAECAEREIGSNSAAHGGADHFLDTIGPENKQSLLTFAMKAADPNSLTFTNALQDLDDRMTLGHELSVTGEKLTDGNPKADTVIWGHTKGLQPKAMIHFVICHFLERAMTQIFAHQDSSTVKDMAAHKDFFLNSLGDVIRLQAAKGKISPEIYELWRLPRNQGGLQWNSDEKQKIYNEVLSQK